MDKITYSTLSRATYDVSNSKPLVFLKKDQKLCPEVKNFGTTFLHGTKT